MFKNLLEYLAMKSRSSVSIKLFSLTCFLIAWVLSVSSCKSMPNNKINLRGTYYWAPCSEKDTYQDFLQQKDKFVHMDKLGGNNLSELVGITGNYVWVTFDFDIPQELQGQDLGLVVPIIKFADDLWLNGYNIAGYGSFPPNETSAWFQGQYFLFSEEILKPQGNTVLIKIWVHGKCRISTEAFIAPRLAAKNYSELLTFLHSRIYIFFEGGMFCAFLLYIFLFFRSRKKSPQHLSFALLNFSTMEFLAAFYAPDMPFYTSQHVSNLLYFKVTLCFNAYAIMYFVSTFILNFLSIKAPKYIKATNLSVFFFQSLITMAAPDYNFLMAICPIMLFLLPLQLGYALFCLFKGLVDKEQREKALTLLQGFAPTLLTIAIDISIRLIRPEKIYMYYTIIGWQLSIIFFLLLLTRQFYSLYYRVEVLNTDLEKQVMIKTHKLSAVNIELENIIRRSNEDLSMAAVVQRKFFPYPSRNFKGWDIYIYYKPLADVSGDLYDYYYNNDKLNGISIFDVSGHGIASSLITMLAKDMIKNLFDLGTINGEKVSETLEKFNKTLSDAKGSVDNYLTGLLFRFGQFDTKDRCNVELVNAGHPYPILYNAETQETTRIKPFNIDSQFGAIGIRGLDVSFQQTEFTMHQNDILVCFTDGILESTNQLDEQFQYERVEQIIKENANRSSKEIIELLTKALDTFRDSKPLQDDITVIVLKRNNSSDYIEELYDNN